MRGHRLEERSSQNGIVVNAEMCQREGTQQPTPNGPLVVGGITHVRGATVVSLITAIGRRKAAKPMRRKQVPGTHVHHGSLLPGPERALCERDRKELVGSQRRIVTVGPVNHVKAPAGSLVPEALEACARLRGS